MCWVFCTEPRPRVPLDRSVRPVGQTGHASPTLGCEIFQNIQQKWMAISEQVLGCCRRCSTRGILNLWSRKVDRWETSHRVPFERDFEGAIERPDWESSQAGGVIQIPKGIAFSLVESSSHQWGRLVREGERAGWRGVGGEMKEIRFLLCGPWGG